MGVGHAAHATVDRAVISIERAALDLLETLLETPMHVTSDPSAEEFTSQHTAAILRDFTRFYAMLRDCARARATPSKACRHAAPAL